MMTVDVSENPSQETVRERFKRVFGKEDNWFEPLLQLDPDFLSVYVALAEMARSGPLLGTEGRGVYPHRHRRCDDQSVRRGTRTPIGAALDHGATVEEILEVLQLSSVLGLHASTEGIPRLLDEAETFDPLTEDQCALSRDVKADFAEEREY
jgi:hypothetical protein